MPAIWNRSSFNQDSRARSTEPSSSSCIEIGIVNNMPDGALQATERQFLALLGSAADTMEVRLTFYALPDLPRSEASRRYIDTCYSRIEALWERPLDALIVTGAEPRMSKVTDEPYWRSFADIIEWAGRNTFSTVWSCLAAHAAVYGLDGISRQRLADKRFGLFPCVRAWDHPLVGGLPSRWVIPHSRWNDLAEQELIERGYEVLSRSEDGSIDAFAKRGGSLFVFFQGHPEYEANSLWLEYLRDVGRYLKGERETHPSLPQHSFEADTEEVLEGLRERAIGAKSEVVVADYAAARVEQKLRNTWRAPGIQIYKNWLTYLAVCKGQYGNGRGGDLSVHGESVPARRLVAGAD